MPGVFEKLKYSARFEKRRMYGEGMNNWTFKGIIQKNCNALWQVLETLLSWSIICQKDCC